MSQISILILDSNWHFISVITKYLGINSSWELFGTFFGDGKFSGEQDILILISDFHQQIPQFGWYYI